MNVAHDLDRVGNDDAIVVKGKNCMISNKISAGSVESITWTLAEQRRSRDRFVAGVVGDRTRRSPNRTITIISLDSRYCHDANRVLGSPR